MKLSKFSKRINKTLPFNSLPILTPLLSFHPFQPTFNKSLSFFPPKIQKINKKTLTKSTKQNRTLFKNPNKNATFIHHFNGDPDLHQTLEKFSKKNPLDLLLMWPRWSGISSRGGSTATSGNKSPSINPSLSFNDLRSLVADEKSSTAAVFHRVRIASSTLRAWKSLAAAAPTPPENNKIVVYYTSLRIVRKTFEECRAVLSILRGFRVAVDERDLSMDLGFIAELKQILGKKELTLPRVFIGGKYAGGFDEIQHLHETGELKRLVEGMPVAEMAGNCEICGGSRFVLCGICNGSHKFYSEKKNGFRSCNACNENGIVRCPDCCG